MKQFKQTKKTPTPSKTPMANKLIDFDQIKEMRIAVYDNSQEAKPYVCEVDFHFEQPQSEWNNQTTVKLRNQLYKINNIAYKMPAGHDDFQLFYEKAVEQCRAFKKHTSADFHNKLGIKYERYYTIPGLMISYDPVTKSGIFQITQPEIVQDTIDVMQNFTTIEFELDESNGSNLSWTFIS